MINDQNFAMNNAYEYESSPLCREMTQNPLTPSNYNNGGAPLMGEGGFGSYAQAQVSRMLSEVKQQEDPDTN